MLTSKFSAVKNCPIQHSFHGVCIDARLATLICYLYRFHCQFPHNHLHQTPNNRLPELDTSFAAMTIAATTALPITTTQANPTFQNPPSNVGAGLLLQQTTNNTTITPAPVTIVRSSPIPPDPSNPLQQPSVPSTTTSGLSIHPPVSMTTASHETYQQTSSGLPTAPPTNFPMPMMMPPTISLWPHPHSAVRY